MPAMWSILCGRRKGTEGYLWVTDCLASSEVSVTLIYRCCSQGVSVKQVWFRISILPLLQDLLFHSYIKGFSTYFTILCASVVNLTTLSDDQHLLQILTI